METTEPTRLWLNVQLSAKISQICFNFERSLLFRFSNSAWPPKCFCWEKLVIGGSLRRPKMRASFHPHPDPPQVPLKLYVNASSDRRRQHLALPCSLKSVDKDVNKYVRVNLSGLMATVMRKTGVHEKVDMHIPGRTQCQGCIQEYNGIFDLMPTHTHTRLMSHIKQ